MLKGVFAFFIFISALLLLLVYFAGDYHLDTDYISNRLLNREVGERDLVFDTGTRNDNSYTLKITSKGKVEFQKNDHGERDYKSFKIEDSELTSIRQKMDSTGVFRVVSLDRNYCFERYEATISFNFGWVNKKVKYSNCVDDPSEVRHFRVFLYKFLGLSLWGT